MGHVQPGENVKSPKKVWGFLRGGFALSFFLGVHKERKHKPKQQAPGTAGRGWQEACGDAGNEGGGALAGTKCGRWE